MDKLRKHWLSLKRAREEQKGWENRWYKWHYPYSRWISIIKGLVVSFVVSVLVAVVLTIT